MTRYSCRWRPRKRRPPRRHWTERQRRCWRASRHQAIAATCGPWPSAPTTSPWRRPAASRSRSGTAAASGASAPWAAATAWPWSSRPAIATSSSPLRPANCRSTFVWFSTASFAARLPRAGARFVYLLTVPIVIHTISISTSSRLCFT